MPANVAEVFGLAPSYVAQAEFSKDVRLPRKCSFLQRRERINSTFYNVHIEISCRFRGLKLLSRLHCSDLAALVWDGFVTPRSTHFQCHKARLPRATAITCGKTVKSISACSYAMFLSWVQESMKMKDHKNVRSKGQTLIWSTLLHNWTTTNLFKIYCH